jgi:uncharacterized protein
VAARYDRGYTMKAPLSPLESRIIGALVEKQITTPDQYPLSLNALVNACNQKSNRDPLLSLGEQEVQAAVDGLIRKGQVLEKSGFGSRVPKYQQRFCNMEFSELKFTPQQTAVVCELLLRGPQTPGELRGRASRMAPFSDVGEVEAALDSLARHEPQALVRKLAREPGRRDSRYAHLFSGPVDDPPQAAELAAPATAQTTVGSDVEGRLARLEEQVRQLSETVASLQREH